MGNDIYVATLAQIVYTNGKPTKISEIRTGRTKKICCLKKEDGTVVDLKSLDTHLILTDETCQNINCDEYFVVKMSPIDYSILKPLDWLKILLQKRKAIREYNAANYVRKS
ncbi:MAG: hypothetical protein PHD02_00375 [Bacilli bacterium]|nr:hypothetical protein [Bacilli bacterium]